VIGSPRSSRCSVGSGTALAPLRGAATERASPAHRTRIPPVGFVRPCEPALVNRPPAGAGWLHEVKRDGFRILVRKLGERAKAWSRRGADFTARFASIAGAVRGLAADEALIDGEAACSGTTDRATSRSVKVYAACRNPR
jgi:ATP-dependent DNA ligase